MLSLLNYYLQYSIDGTKVFLKRPVSVIGRSYRRLCLKLYIAWCFGSSSAWSLWLLSHHDLASKCSCHGPSQCAYERHSLDILKKSFSHRFCFWNDKEFSADCCRLSEYGCPL